MKVQLGAWQVPLTWLSPMIVLAFERVYAIVPSRNICRCLLHVDIGTSESNPLSYVGNLLGNSSCREGFVPELLHRHVCVFKGGNVLD